MTTANESCEHTGQMSLFGETCEPLQPQPSMLPTPTTSDAMGDFGQTAEMRKRAGRQVELRHQPWNTPTVRDASGSAFANKKFSSQDVSSQVLTSSPQATPASHSHSPGSDWARRMTATYGRKLSAYWLSCDPPDSWVRTLLGISTWASTTCYLTWKKSVTPHGRLLFRLVPSTPRTAGIGSGLWPTPTGNPNDDRRSKPIPAEIEGRHGWSLNSAVIDSRSERPNRLWPTPNVAGGGNNCELTPHKGHYLRPSGEKAHLGLDQAARMWPTPHASSSTGAAEHGTGAPNLQTAVKLWGTPTSRDHKDVGDMSNVPENGLLGRQVLNDARLLATPRAIYGEHAGMSDESHLTGQAGATGSLKLNSAWVSRMMGYPDDWLILDGEAIQ